jgi:hypothetical protein
MPRFAHSPRPTDTCWGGVQSAHEVIPGAWIVETASHGGIVLSEERQAAMPDALRLPGREYEEDCDWALPVLAFAAEMAGSPIAEPSWISLARDTAMCWHPDRYTAFTGEDVPENKSHVLKRRNALTAAIGKFCVTSAWGSWAAGVPEGKVGVVAYQVRSVDHLGNARYEDTPRYALVDAALYDKRDHDACLLDTLDPEILDAPFDTKAR